MAPTPALFKAVCNAGAGFIWAFEKVGKPVLKHEKAALVKGRLGIHMIHHPANFFKTPCGNSQGLLPLPGAVRLHAVYVV
jgi:hypothetical protein